MFCYFTFYVLYCREEERGGEGRGGRLRYSIRERLVRIVVCVAVLMVMSLDFH